MEGVGERERWKEKENEREHKCRRRPDLFAAGGVKGVGWAMMK